MEQEREQEQRLGPAPEPECAALESAMGAAAVLERMAQVVMAAKVAPASPAPMLLKRSMVSSPAGDWPDEPPPRAAVVSEDTKTFDRGRRKGGNTHTHPLVVSFSC
eukprot:COSAG01_NODE_13821_length_1530_cov_2.250874_1_plen_106_part_00